MKKRKTTECGKLEQKCEVLWRKVILKRDPVCRLCHKRPSVHSHHIVFRTEGLATKFDLDNGAGLCLVCHGIAHDTPGKQIGTAYSLVGVRGYEALKDRAREIIYSANRYWFLMKVEQLEAELDR